ncbi:alkaline serine protease [Pseudoalteromonas sp. NBT06-2]|uniref:S8 family serine peptidase n=1 Tax=Pseudoalteromonas sp. NBT06-2 TaxID=2025950 RepID=UPI000BA65BA5|nr:S8 family serine peptidase [Pseudoalteromonas sp. NBT06-2]PAJ74180.1 alkaline serine protease [Pseudoalteromonas sp. NBT06-2]
MNNKTKISLATGFALSLITSGIQASTSAQLESTDKAQRFIVHLNDSAIFKAQSEANSAHSIQAAKLSLMKSTANNVNAILVHTLSDINAIAVELNAEQKAALLKDENVGLVEVDPKRYLLSESTPYGISMVQAQQLSDSQSSNRKVCIMDTGYTLNHPDLPNTGVTGDDGYGSNDTGNWYNDGNGHGTHVAGTIAAIGGNNQGVVGVNPSGQLGLHIVKVFNDSGNWAYGSDLIAAINQCEAAGANITSMSLGGGGSSTAEKQAFDNSYNRGMLHIAAAGNDGNSSMSYPASYDSVVSVAAVDSSGTKASFSQYNSQVEIAAPGVNVNSTWNNNAYKSISGTSMATPHVSGVAALVWSNNLSCSNQDIRNALNNTAQDKGASGRDTSYGYGIVKAKNASDYLANSNCGTTDQKPIANFSHSINGKSVTFTDNSTDDKGINVYSWSFGDGATSTSQNPTHTYSADGEYNVTLTVTDTASQTDHKTIQVKVGTVSCDGYPAWSSTTSYKTDDLASYNNRKYKATWWSTGAKPTIFTNVWQDQGECKNGGPDENQAPKAKFSVSTSQLTANFTDNSTDDKGVTAYDWSFGDGNTSASKNPSHTYASAGTYQVSLTVSDTGNKTDTYTNSVSVSEANQGCSGLEVWSASTVYSSGTEVALNGTKYKNNWWSQGDNPEQNSGPWQVWSNLGSCQ